MAVYGYTRVSTDQQAREGASLDEQARQITVYAELYRLSPPSIVREEGVSGSVPLDMRGQGGVMLARLQRGDILIASKLYRMFRNARDALRIIKRFQGNGIRLHLLDMGGEVINGPVAKLVFTVLVACAQFERDRIAERSREAHTQRRLQGKQNGAAVFGWRHTEEPGVWREEPREQEIIREICRLKRLSTPLNVISATIAQKYGVTLSTGRIHLIWWRTIDPGGYQAHLDKQREREREREARRWDNILRPETRARSWVEAVSVYALSLGFTDLAREAASYPPKQRQNVRRLQRLAAAFRGRIIDTIGQDDLTTLANEAFPTGSDGTKDREVMGPAASIIHYAAAQGWIEDWQVTRFYGARLMAA
jgi:putative DNA-invertase from lambdoid prophage Rac